MSSSTYDRKGFANASEHSTSYTTLSNTNQPEDIPLVDYDRKELEHRSLPQRRRTFLSFLAWWLPEILASVFSIATFIAIVCVLSIYNGKPLSDLNLPAYLTLNGIIAALATLNRACLMTPVGSAIMQEIWLVFAAAGKRPSITPGVALQDLELFDSASRGAFGSVGLLSRARGHRLFACAGAAITILSLAFGTFTQQLVAYDRMVPAPHNSSLSPGNVPRTEVLSDWALGNPVMGSVSPPYDAVAAFYQGVLTGGVAPLTAPCTAGNCTWPLTPSLAVCGGCQVSPALAPPKCFAGCLGDNFVGSSVPVSSNCTKIPNLFCNYTMPSGSVATMFNWNNQTLQGMTNGGYPGFRSLAGAGAYYNASKLDRMYIANFDTIGAPYNSYVIENTRDWKHSECALWFCVQTYKVSQESNRQNQVVVSSHDKLLNASDYYGINGMFSPLPSSIDPNKTTSFGIAGDTTLYGLISWTSTNFEGSIGMLETSQSFSSDMIKGIWNGTQNRHLWIDNIALALTNVVRQANQTSRSEFDGTGYQLGVSLRWKWLVVPASAVLLSVVFLGAVMVRTALSPAAPWKCSPLMLLMCDVDERVRQAVCGQAGQYGGLKRAVGGVRVRLEEEPGRTWAFRAT